MYHDHMSSLLMEVSHLSRICFGIWVWGKKNCRELGFLLHSYLRDAPSESRIFVSFDHKPILINWPKGSYRSFGSSHQEGCTIFSLLSQRALKAYRDGPAVTPQEDLDSWLPSPLAYPVIILHFSILKSPPFS